MAKLISLHIPIDDSDFEHALLCETVKTGLIRNFTGNGLRYYENGEPIWSINTLSQCWKYRIYIRPFNSAKLSNSYGVRRERFIDHIKVNYPDQFHWLLFNPEWLND